MKLFSLALVLLFTPFAHAAGDIVLKDPAAPAITIEEYSDFECPFCKRGAETMEQIMKAYDGKIKLVFRNMPIPKIHPHALEAAKALTAVNFLSPGLVYAYQGQVFAHQEQLELSTDVLYETADHLGVNVAKMRVEMQSERVAKRLAEDEALAKEHGFQGTPSFRIGSEDVVGSRPLSDFKQIIDHQLNP